MNENRFSRFLSWLEESGTWTCHVVESKLLWKPVNLAFGPLRSQIISNGWCNYSCL